MPTESCAFPVTPGNSYDYFVQFFAYSIPMRTRFRGITVREGMIVRGTRRWSEFSPFWDYDAKESSSWLRAAIESAEKPWPAPVRDRVPVNVTVPAVGPKQAADIVNNSHGCQTAKVKVAEPGQTVDDEADRVAAVRDALGPTGKIRIDVNAHWDVQTALDRIQRLNRAAGGLEYVEQPCPTVAELAQVRRRQNVLIAADESIRRATDPFDVVRHHAADIIVVKVQPLGGVDACLRLAEQVGLPVVASSALETSVGIAAGVALAAALPELPFACGLSTVQLLAKDIVDQPLLPENGCLDVREVTVREDLGGALADKATTAKWADRLQACQAFL